MSLEVCGGVETLQARFSVVELCSVVVTLQGDGGAAALTAGLVSRLTKYTSHELTIRLSTWVTCIHCIEVAYQMVVS